LGSVGRRLFIFVFLLAPLFFSGEIAQATKFVGNGGDAFEVGDGKIKIFDEIEYSRAFYPPDEPAYQTIILPQIEKLSKRLPVVAAYLKFIFEHGAMWYIVDAKLKDVDASGSTNLILTSNKIQAAVTKNGITQISRDVKDKLSIESFAFLMLHEALWSADADPKIMQLFGPMASVNMTEGDDYYQIVPIQNLRMSTTSEKIRGLTGILMNPMIDRYEARTLARLMEPNTGMAFDMISPVATGVSGRGFQMRFVGFTTWTLPFSLPENSSRTMEKLLLDRNGMMVTGLLSHRSPLGIVLFLDEKLSFRKRNP